ncbi:MAG: YdjY domain-containing protein [Thermoguttaceae bacterium]
MELLSGMRHWGIVAAGFFAALGLGVRVWAAEPSAKPGAAPAGTETQQSGQSPTLDLKVDGPVRATVGQRITFEITITNVGSIPARKLLVIDRFDPGLEHAVGQSPIERPLDDLPPERSQRIGLSFRVARAGRLSHTLEVTSGGKAVVSATCSVTAAGKQEPPAPAKDDSVQPAEESFPAPPGMKLAPGSAFPEIRPKEAPPEEQVPDLGPPLVENPQDLKRLHPKYPVWVDPAGKRVILVGAVCARECPLELFACLRASKEHESIVAVPVKAVYVHAGLLVVGAKPGRPVQFRPKYVPASGTQIEVTVVWKDQSGTRHSARAQEWVREAKTKRAMEHPWVFAGSRFEKHPTTGREFYVADATGELICVSNFPSAMLDLPIQSTSADAELLFECFTERIPPRGTPVTLILTPQIDRASRPENAAPKPLKTPAPAKPSQTEPETARPPEPPPR